MSDVNTEPSSSEGAVDNTATDTAQDTSSADSLNTAKVSESVPYDRFQEKVNEVNTYKAEIEQLKTQSQQSYQPQYAQPQTYQQPSQGYTPQYNQPQSDPLVDQFGYEGAQAVRQSVVQPLLQQMFTSEYSREYDKGISKHGDQFKKFDYVDQNGTKQNKIMDLRIKGLDIDQAWNAMNPVNVDDIRQKIKDETYQEMNKKAEATPSSSSNAAPSSSGVGHATTTEEAFKQAMQQLSRG